MYRFHDENSKRDLLQILSDLKDHHNALMGKIHWYRRQLEAAHKAFPAAFVPGCECESCAKYKKLLERRGTSETED